MGSYNSDNSFITQHFLNEKKPLFEIFERLRKCEDDTLNFMKNNNLGSKDDKEKIQALLSRLKNINGALARDNLKLAVFGRTSNGKSTVINAILGKEILPSGCGVTTNCIIQIEGAETAQAYMIRDNSGVRENISNISAADALSDDALQECTTIVRIYWPKNSCGLLRDNVVVVDTPGVDKTNIIDEIVEMNWLDADVHIFVVNAVSGIADSERKLMMTLSQKLSIPNVFILFNKWDEVISKSKPEKMQKLHSKYIEESVSLLTDELKASKTPQEAFQRVFFISAERVLNARANNENDDKPELSCYSEFQNFERKCGECISNSAVDTKIANHARSGKEICSSLMKILPVVLNIVSSEIARTRQMKEKLCQEMDQANREYENMDIHSVLSGTVEEAEKRMKNELDQGIGHARNFVNNYRSIPYDESRAKTWIDDLKAEFGALINGEICSKLITIYDKSIDEIQSEMARTIMKKKKMLELFTQKEITMENCLALLKKSFTISQAECFDNINKHLPSSAQAPGSEGITTTRNVFAGLTPGCAAVGIIPTPPTMVIGLIGLAITGIGALISNGARNDVFRTKEREIRGKYRAYINNDIQEFVKNKTQELSSLLNMYKDGILKKFSNLVNGRMEMLQNDVRGFDDKLMKLNKQYEKTEELQSEAQSIATEFNLFSQQYIHQ